MTHRSADAHDPTVLAASRYGTLWLLDARMGAIRWRLVNGCRLGELAHGGDLIYFTAYSSGWVRRDTRQPPTSRAELRQDWHLLVTPAEIVAVRTQDGSVAWRREGWVRKNQPLRILFGGCPLDGGCLVTDVTDFAETTPMISALDATSGAIRWRSPCADEAGAGQLQGACAGRVYVYRKDSAASTSSTPQRATCSGALSSQGCRGGASRREGRFWPKLVTRTGERNGR
jgi:hypothetical protein